MSSNPAGEKDQPPLIDLRFGGGDMPPGIAGLVPLAVLLVLLLYLLLPIPMPLQAVAAVPLACITGAVALAVQQSIRLRRARQAVLAQCATSPPSTIDALRATIIYPDPAWRLQLVGLALEQCGRHALGTTVRVTSLGTSEPIDPIRVSFEPTPFSYLLGDWSPGSAQPAERLDSERRVGLIPSLLAAAFVIVVTCAWIYVVIRAITVALDAALRYDDPIAITALCAAGLGLLWLISKWRLGRQEQWWIMPGGVIRRTARWWDPAWHIAAIRRQDSVCCIIQDAIGDGWEARIWCGRIYRLTFISKDATNFLRAWLSPIQTPTADQLTDMR